MNKQISVVIAIAAAFGAGIVFFIYSNSISVAPSHQTSPAAQAYTVAPQTSGNQAAAPAAAPGQSASSSPASVRYAVVYTDSGFSPNTLTVPQGGTVVFKNGASDDVWVGSNPHPIHNGYPTTGGCISSTFDSCADIPPGQSWSFTFAIKGRWGYHNHLNPGEGGTIVVQ